MKTHNIYYYIDKDPTKTIFLNGFKDEISSTVFFDLHDDHHHYYDIDLIKHVYTEINTIPDDPLDKFYFPVPFVRSNMKDLVEDHFTIPDDILACIRSGQCKILVQSVQEGWTYGVFIDVFIDNIIKKYNLKDMNFVLLTGNNFKHKRFIAHYHSVWEIGMPYHWSDKTPETLDKIRPYKYICLNRRPEIHRLAITTMLTTSSEPGILTLAETGGYGDDQWARIDKDFYNRFPDYKSHHINNVKPKIPFVYDDGINPEITNPNWDPQVEKFHNSYLHIVTETNSGNEQLFFSEKAFKPIVHWQPFVILGNPGSIALLNEWGYNTFDGYIDQSYDKEQNTEIRVRKIHRAVSEFINKPAEELTKLMQEMRPQFEHNMINLRNRSEHVKFNNTRANLLRALHATSK
mgnify:CR=1 FL=1|tara:strand:+ start:1463 stop:2674 length:1212 start_codon:yes stop_codon:yes gene_type:complete